MNNQGMRDATRGAKIMKLPPWVQVLSDSRNPAAFCDRRAMANAQQNAALGKPESDVIRG